MFGKLKQQRFITKKTSPDPVSPPAKSPNRVTRSKSYSRMQKQKQNSSELYDYEIAWICDHLYQGCFSQNRKHGEGIMVLSNGVAVLGNWKKGWLDGYALFVSPFGGKIHATYQEGKLHGWLIVEYRNSFEILQFNRDVPSGIRRRYDEEEQLWTQAKYSRDGKLEKISAVQKTKDFKLPSYVVDEGLTAFYDEVIMKGQSKLKRKKLEIIKINENFEYFGFTNKQKVPQGLGVIYSSRQLYTGNFKNGSLDEYGLILFQNGLMYKGQIYGGKIWGDGVIYDINLDESKSVRVCQQGIEYVLDHEEGFHIDAVPFNFGKIPKMPEEKGFSSSIQPIFEEITKYYYRSNSTVIQESSDSNSGSESQPSSIKQNSQNQNPEYFQQPRISEPKSLPNRQLKTPQPRQNTKKASNPSSLSFSLEQQKHTPQTQASGNGHHQGIPSSTPSFDQIAKQTQSKPKYPYLLEFEMSKNIFSPYKFSKIGRIVANSIKLAERLECQ